MALTATQERKLDRLYNRRTAYELIAEKDGERVLIAYSTGRSRRDVLTCLCNRSKAFTALTGAAEITFDKRAAKGAVTPTGWSIKWSGRTQREAIIEGELPYIES